MKDWLLDKAVSPAANTDLPNRWFLQGDIGEIGLDGINGEEVRKCYKLLLTVYLKHMTEGGMSVLCHEFPKTFQIANIFCFNVIVSICSVFSGQIWSGWTPGRQRKPWQESEWLRPIHLTLLCDNLND